MTVPETTSERRFLRPCEYYSSATLNPILPPWASYGCGAAALLILVLVFVGGILMSSGNRFAQFMDFAVGMSVSEMKGMYTPGVTREQKEAVDGQVKQMSANLRGEKIPVTALRPFLDALKVTTKDKKVTPAEARQLEEAVRKVNASARR